MNRKIAFFVFTIFTILTSIAQENNSIVYNFDTIIEYDEYREKDKKTYKRYYLINSRDSVKTRRVEIYEKEGNYILYFSYFGFAVKSRFPKDSFKKSNKFLIKKETNDSFNDSIYTVSSMPYDNRILYESKFKFNIKKSTSKLKGKIFIYQDDEKQMIDKAIEKFDHSFKNYEISTFSEFYRFMDESDKNDENKYGILNYAEYLDWNVSSNIRLEFNNLEHKRITITVNKNAMRYPSKWKPKESSSEKTP